MPTHACAPAPDTPLVMVVVPVYNHGATLTDVVCAALALHPHVLVVDDASTDLGYEKDAERPDCAPVPDASHPLRGLAVSCLRHQRNLGKGAAILTGAAAAAKKGMTHIITIDADNQHDPADLPGFLAAASADPLAIYVGERDFNTPNVPLSSRFGRSFSNFWHAVQTGRRTKDVQSGFRLYPLAVLDKIRCLERRYGFETEVLVRAAWAGFAIKNLPIKVRYQPARERVSHFRPLMDNLRLTLLNSWLTARSFLPWPQKKFLPDESGNLSALHPLRSLRLVLADRTTPKNVALAAAIGMGISALPLFGLHTMAILLFTGVFRVNRFVGLAAGQLGMPPFVPALCIEVGHYLRHGRWLTEISLQTLGYEALDRVWEWCLGSLALAPLLGLLCGALAYAAAWGLNRNMKTPAGDPEAMRTTSVTPGKSAGSRAQHLIFYALIGRLGVHAAYVLLFFVVSWYTFKPSTSARCRPYLERRFPGCGGLRTLGHIWKLQWNFGLCLVDRAAAGISGRFFFAGNALDAIHGLVGGEDGRKTGLILLSAHTGARHMAQAFLAGHAGCPVHVLGVRDRGDVDREAHEHSGTKAPYSVIDPADGPVGVVRILSILRAKEILCMMGDRAFGSDATLTANFLGEPAPLPYLAFRMSAASGAPVAVVFHLRTGVCRGETRIADVIHVPAGLKNDPEAYRHYVQRFASLLEAFTAEHPYQFFNFFNLWGK